MPIGAFICVLFGQGGRNATESMQLLLFHFVNRISAQSFLLTSSSFFFDDDMMTSITCSYHDPQAEGTKERSTSRPADKGTIEPAKVFDAGDVNMKERVKLEAARLGTFFRALIRASKPMPSS
jgi:hypothetical protein